MNLDKTFNPISGFVKTFNTLGDQYIGVSVAIRSDKRIVMGGYKIVEDDLGIKRNRIVLVCYNQDGSLYSTGGFGSTSPGITIEPFRDGYDENVVNDIALLPDNSIIVTGTMRFIIGLGNTENRMFVAKFSPNGVLDTSFGTPILILGPKDGFAVTTPGDFATPLDVTYDNCYSNSVAITTDGKIVIGGYVHQLDLTNSIDINYVALVKYTSAGELDTAFNSGSTPKPGCNKYKADNLADEECTNIKLQADGSIVVGCVSTRQTFGSGNRFMVFRTDANGVQDTGFNSIGYNIISNFYGGSFDYSTGLGINSSGDILIGGTVASAPNIFYGIACLASDGTIKLSFGPLGTGKTVLDLAALSINVVSPNLAASHSLAIQSDDKIVIACGCESTTTTNAGFLLARFTNNGLQDTTFSVSNLSYIISDLVPSPPTEIGYSVAIQSDGKILVGGTTSYAPDASPAEHYFILARYSIAENIPTIVVPICFPAGTPVLTDQGYVEIHKIDPATNTIRGHSIVAITKTISPDNKLVCFERGSLGYNVPNRTTYVSLYHGIIYKNKLIASHKFANKMRGIYFVKYNGKHLYNVLLRKHVHMVVNNMKVETLNPSNIVSQLYLNDYNIADKIKLILKINESSKNNNDAKHRMTINYNKTNYTVHRFNPRYHNIIFTRRNNVRNHPNQIPNVSYNAKIKPSTSNAVNDANVNAINVNDANVNAINVNDANVNAINVNDANVNAANVNAANVNAANVNGANAINVNANVNAANAINVNCANVNAANVNGANVNAINVNAAKHNKTLKNLIRLRSFWTHKNPHNRVVNANRYFNRRRW